MSHAIELGSRPLHSDKADINTATIPPLGETQRLLAWQQPTARVQISELIAAATSGQPADQVHRSFHPDASLGIPMKYDSQGMRRGVSFSVLTEKVFPVNAMLYHEIAQGTQLSIKEKLATIGLIEATTFYHAQGLPDGNSRYARGLGNYLRDGVDGIADGYNGIGDMCPPDSLENDFMRHAVGQHGDGRFDTKEVMSGRYPVNPEADALLERADSDIVQMVGPKLVAENGKKMKDAMHGRMVTIGRELHERLADKDLSAEVATILCQKVGHAALAILQTESPNRVTKLEDIDVDMAHRLLEINDNVLSSRIIQIITGIARGGKFFSYDAKESQTRVRRWMPRIQTYEEYVASRMEDATVPPDQLLNDM